MKTQDKIREKLKEFREKRFKLDKNMKVSENFSEFESLVTLEGGIEALKWVLKEVKNENQHKSTDK